MSPAYRNSLALLLVAAMLVRLAAGWFWQSRLDGRFRHGRQRKLLVAGPNHRRGETLRVRGRPCPRVPHARLPRASDADHTTGRQRPQRRAAGPGGGGAAGRLGGARPLVAYATVVRRSCRAVGGRHGHVLSGRDCGQHAPLERSPVLPALVAATGVLDHGMACGQPTANGDLWILRRPGGGGGHVDASQLAVVYAPGRGRGDIGGTGVADKRFLP